MKQIAGEAGVSRTAMGRAFAGVGVEIRGRSDAERLKWAGMDSEKRAAQVAAAHVAARGRVDTLASKLARAKTRYERLLHRGHMEDAIGRELQALGHRIDWQLPVGPYNVDIAIHGCRIAVEVSCGGGKASRRSLLPKRTQHIVDAGWTVIFVEAARGGRAPSLVAERIHAISQSIGRDHASRGQYGVISGQGEALPSHGPHLDHLTRIRGL